MIILFTYIILHCYKNGVVREIWKGKYWIERYLIVKLNNKRYTWQLSFFLSKQKVTLLSYINVNNLKKILINAVMPKKHIEPAFLGPKSLHLKISLIFRHYCRLTKSSSCFRRQFLVKSVETIFLCLTYMHLSIRTLKFFTTVFAKLFFFLFFFLGPYDWIQTF